MNIRIVIEKGGIKLRFTLFVLQFTTMITETVKNIHIPGNVFLLRADSRNDVNPDALFRDL